MPQKRFAILGNNGFLNRAAIHRYASTILNSYKPGEKVRREHELFLRELLICHPEGLDKLMDSRLLGFEVDWRSANSLGFYYNLENGMSGFFGINECVKGVRFESLESLDLPDPPE